jgi:hypothetical protein
MADQSKWHIYAARAGNGEGDYHNGARYEIRRDHCIINKQLNVDVSYTFDEVMAIAQADCDKHNAPPKPEPRTFLGRWSEVPTFEEAEPAGRNHHGVSMVMGCDGRELIPLHNPLPRNHFFVRFAAQSSGVPVAGLREAMQSTSDYPLEGLIKIRALCDKYQGGGK